MQKDNQEVFEVWRVAQSVTKFRRNNEIVMLPDNWVFVQPGDATLTKRIKATGDYWQVYDFYKHKKTARGLCAPIQIVDSIKAQLESERSSPEYEERLEKGREYRAKKEVAYQGDFKQCIIDFLHFDPRWAKLAQLLAEAVTKHSTPVGAGTVARTKMIPIEQRAEAALIAWMRHQTTAYDKMYIPRVAGQRREVRHKLAEKSREILAKYRSSNDVDLELCPLAIALNYKE